jgi:hypothetical protein
MTGQPDPYEDYCWLKLKQIGESARNEGICYDIERTIEASALGILYCDIKLWGRQLVSLEHIKIPVRWTLIGPEGIDGYEDGSYGLILPSALAGHYAEGGRAQDFWYGDHTKLSAGIIARSPQNWLARASDITAVIVNENRDRENFLHLRAAPEVAISAYEVFKNLIRPEP